MTTEDPIRRSTALGPPTRAEVILFHVLRVVRRHKPKWFDEIMESAHDEAAATAVRRLHEADGLPEWEQPFVEAEVRLDSAARMIEAEPTKRRKKRR